MSDRTAQALSNLTFEVTQLATDNAILYQRLHKINPDLVSVSDVQVAEQRVRRLRAMLNSLQNAKD